MNLFHNYFSQSHYIRNGIACLPQTDSIVVVAVGLL